MRSLKLVFYYLFIIFIFAYIILFFLDKGLALEINNFTIPPKLTSLPNSHFLWETLLHNFNHPLAILLLQIITIIFVSRIFGFIFKKIGQPSVVGEIFAGILLGPSLLGLYFPEITKFLFPTNSLGNLQFLSQIGLILFMFVIGMELDLKVLKTKAHDALLVSHASIIFPFALGIILAYFIYTDFAPKNVQFHSFALFLGIAMSITAFPILARIVQEKGLNKTKLGTLVITCAAIDDITAWCILASIIAIVKAGSFASSYYTILLTLSYIVFMFKVMRPILKRIGEIYSNKEILGKSIVALFFLMLLCSSYTTEVIGIHALFGAFMAGLIMPENVNFRSIFTEKVQDIALVLLLPLFFVYTGLRTEIQLLLNFNLLYLTLVVIVLAILGKLVGSAVAAKIAGQTWRDSLFIGTLMNTRGLMELVVLNIGFDLGLLNTELFSILVLMALVTTFSTGPMLGLVYLLFPLKTKISSVNTEKKITNQKTFRVLISFGDPQKGPSMLKIVSGLLSQKDEFPEVTALHFSPNNEVNQISLEEYEKLSFEPILTESKKLKLNLVKIFKTSRNIEKDVIQVSNTGKFNFVIIGVGQSIFSGSFFYKLFRMIRKFLNKPLNYSENDVSEISDFDTKTKNMIRSVKCPIGIFIDKGFHQLRKICFLINSMDDLFLLEYLKQYYENKTLSIEILDCSENEKLDQKLTKKLEKLKNQKQNKIKIYKLQNLELSKLQSYDLLISSKSCWISLIIKKLPWMENSPSVLIINK